MGKISIDTLFPNVKHKKTGLDIETIFPKSVRSDSNAKGNNPRSSTRHSNHAIIKSGNRAVRFTIQRPLVIL